MASSFMARFCFAVTCVLFLYSCKKDDGLNRTPPGAISPPPDFGLKVVGYLSAIRDPSTIPDEKFRICNVINYAFATINTNGDLIIGQITRLPLVVAKARANQAKVLISVNSPSSFKMYTATAVQRNALIKAIMKIVRAYQLDGVDIDWEYPNTADGTDIAFASLMKELSDSCHLNARYYLSAAITPGKYPGGIRDAVKNELFNYVDWFNVMAYDDYNTAVPYKHHSDFSLAESSINYWIVNRGMPANKFVLGIPGYGRSSGPVQGNTTLVYSDILNKGGSPLSDSAVVTITGNPNPYTIYYNGQATVKKKAMLAKQRANGIMFWEIGQDTKDGTSLLRAVADTLGRSY
jgi:GH18 family chitinase